jgi:inositol transport system ATP-binding protein
MKQGESFAPWVLQVRHLSKSFPGVRALDDVQFDLRRGEVHALLGANGAGKSTLMRILAGLCEPDAGEILFQGHSIRLNNPHTALRAGIGMVHQELLPFPEMTVAENLFMGQEPASRYWGWIDRRTMQLQAQDLVSQLGLSVSPMRKMKSLSIAQMQLVEIAKALAHRASILILDEPTSAISDREVEKLFDVINDLRKQGVAVIYISHRMAEVMRLADRVTIFRDGRYVATHARDELDEHNLITLMAGRDPRLGGQLPAAGIGGVSLAVRGLRGKLRFRDIHFELRQGEVLGLAGLMGSGRTELLEAIYGLTPAEGGEILVNGQRVHIACPSDALALGIALVCEDRKKQGLVLGMSLKHNVTLSKLRGCCRAEWIVPEIENNLVDRQIQALAIKTAHRDQKVALLSGGNQQKVVIGKALLSEPKVLLLDEPTRGIDVAAKAEVHAIISRLAQEGKAILLVSSELSELLSLSHRLLVLREGVIVAELDPRTTSLENLMAHAVPR